MSYPSTPPPGYYGPPPEHPDANTALILGILGLSLCGVCAPFAWIKGRKVLAEIDAGGGRVGGRSQANAGYIMGIIGTCMLALSVLIVVGAVLLMVVSAGSSSY
ncbi:DUF4190 domain-containing protein [Nocardia lasii]|uniref:DUF4190 domain-containing protein n=1 Tax=Nocardia lasii TaxID=1616107 RepID=A0ABW1JPB9_9NOCA